ncbi:aspartic proteinase-like protein 2 [Selaginella moellendorffii]|uniref:aspartic proteinase-like protein 2 n=1 Tax=Selaginella moellendorffii TaxID=88036 RepID=UPI000D1CD1E8|nr:aspartic proteinase-like protein 2 [Selaginella moellendorffii]|eukprot:XP_024530855.1 aspartic proteinase-like protein 2 [Selaginella moellendorffii]
MAHKALFLLGLSLAQLGILSVFANPMVMPLELVANSHRRRDRELLGSARMDLHDDLLTKGYYTSRVKIGTPPHEFSLIVDTGSCGNHQDPRFSPALSSSYKPLECGNECSTGFCDGSRCKYQRQYAEKSTSSGVLGKDVISFSNSSDLGGQRLVFGCETAETGDLYDQTADGIIGLGRGPLSIIDQLVEKNAMEDVFSLCYGGMDEGGGAMILGGFQPPKDMVFTSSDPHRSPYYNLMLKGIRVGGSPLRLKPEVFDGKYGTVLDSGTTYAYFPGAAFQAFKSAVKEQVGSLKEVPGPDEKFKDICYAGAGTNVSNLSQFFPSVDFVFGDGQSVTLSPENYLFRHTKISGAYCLGVFENGDPTTLLGGIIVRNMLVTYNRGKASIGFLKTKCNDLWSRLPETNEPGHSTQPAQFLLPPAPSPSVGAGDMAGAIEVSMLLATNYTTFASLTAEFVKDVARELDLDLDQVRILNFTAAGSSIVVAWMAFPNEMDSTKQLISRLERHEVHLSEVFGVYNLTSCRVLERQNFRQMGGSRQREIAAATLIVAVCIILVCTAGGVIYWQLWRFRRNKQHSYQTIEEQTIEEQQHDNEAGVQLQHL